MTALSFIPESVTAVNSSLQYMSDDIFYTYKNVLPSGIKFVLQYPCLVACRWVDNMANKFSTFFLLFALIH